MGGRKEDRAAWKKTMVYNNRGFRYVGLNVTASEVRAEDGGSEHRYCISWHEKLCGHEPRAGIFCWHFTVFDYIAFTGVHWSQVVLWISYMGSWVGFSLPLNIERGQPLGNLTRQKKNITPYHSYGTPMDKIALPIDFLKGGIFKSISDLLLDPIQLMDQFQLRRFSKGSGSKNAVYSWHLKQTYKCEILARNMLAVFPYCKSAPSPVLPITHGGVPNLFFQKIVVVFCFPNHFLGQQIHLGKLTCPLKRDHF